MANDYSNIKLIEHLPQNYHGKNIELLLSVVDSELIEIEDSALSIGLQWIIDKATYGLDDWERLLGIERNPNANLKDRREVIKAKLRGYGTATKEMIQNTAQAFSGGEVEMVEYPNEFRFTVKFVGVKGIPSNMDNFIEMLNKIKSTHSDYDFEYTYTIWSQLRSSTWNDVSSQTWDELRVY